MRAPFFISLTLVEWGKILGQERRSPLAHRQGMTRFLAREWGRVTACPLPGSPRYGRPMASLSAFKPVLDLVVIDCPDALVLSRFYSELLGWPFEDGASSDWVTLVPPESGVSSENPNGRTSLAFQRIEDWVTPTWPGGSHPQQFHLDFAVGDIEAAERAVLALGARRHDHQPSEDGGFRVYVDPAGHPFCLIR